MATVRQERETYRTLDAIRGCAAILVMFYHSEFLVGFSLAPYGYLAVDLFFMLSGFVISHSYDSRFETTLTVPRFGLLRIVRFWPMYVLGLGFGCLFELLLIATHNAYAMPIQTLGISTILGIFVLPTLIATRSNYIFPINNVSWSLFFELVVNMLYAGLFRYMTTRILTVISIVTGIWFLVAGMMHGSLNLGAYTNEMGGGLIRTIFGFSLGVLIYRSRIRSLPIPFWLLAFVLIAACTTRVPDAYRVPYEAAIIFILSPIIVIAGASRQPSQRMLPLALGLGMLSYPLYAVHRPLLSFAATIERRLDLPQMPFFIAVAIVIPLLSLALNTYVDVPVRRWLSQRLGLSNAPKPKEVSVP